MSDPGAFVLKGVPAPFHHGALSVCRTLGRLGVAVAANDERPGVPAARSRFRAESLVWDPWPQRAEDVVERLIAWGSRQDDRAVLIPVDDAATILVDDHVEELAPFFRFAIQPDGLAQQLSSKLGMAEMAERHGVATARVSLIGSDADLDALLDSFGLPVVVKRIAGWKAETRGVPSVTVARTRDEVRALGAAGWENFLLQEFIPGGSETSWMFNGCFDENSRCTFGLTGYKVRQFPLNGGFTTLGQLEPHEALLSTAVEFFRQVSYVGIVDVGFRFDARDNSYKLLDVNPRVGSTFRLFVDANGGDVVRAYYRGLTNPAPHNDPVPTSRARRRRWEVEPHDLRAGIGLIGSGRTTARAFLRSVATVDERAWWASDDPMPFAAACAYALRPRSGSTLAHE
jgi:predicted ATP-grasp superfamily ATP-dependent carboligase